MAAIRTVQPPSFTVIAAFCRNQYGRVYSIFLTNELNQTMLVFLGTGGVAVQLFLPPLSKHPYPLAQGGSARVLVNFEQMSRVKLSLNGGFVEFQHAPRGK